MKDIRVLPNTKTELMQQAVSKTFKSAEHDPLAEADDLDALGTFLESWDIPDEEILRMKTLLVSRTFLDVPRVGYRDSASALVDVVPVDFVPDESLDEALAAKEKLLKEKQQVWNRGRSELLGSDHKQTRANIRANLEPGYYISYSGKKRIKVLHRLGQCFMLPGVDFMTYEYAGSSFPDSSSYETVCKWCAKSKVFRSDEPGNETQRSTPSSSKR